MATGFGGGGGGGVTEAVELDVYMPIEMNELCARCYVAHIYYICIITPLVFTFPFLCSLLLLCLLPLPNFLIVVGKTSFGVCSTYLRSLYLRCNMSTNPKLFSSRSCFFFNKKFNIDSILCFVQIYGKISIFHGKIARYEVLKIKFVDISHRRYKLRRDIE